MLFKYFVFAFLILIHNAEAQSPYQQPANGGNVVFGGFMNNFGGTYVGSMRLGDAAAIMAQGNFSVDQSQANINNQTAESMYYDNKLKKTRTYFENRQINSYSRDIEEWQKNTRRQLRGAGMYDREAIEYIYGIRR
jgi:hypothetical protein